VRPGPLGVLAGLGVLVAACAGAPPHQGAPPAPSKRTTATTAPPLASYLTGFGATTVQWDANHTVDPNQTGFWPRLDNGKDTYEDVRTLNGRVVGYVENFDPPVSSQTARFSVMSELPTDAQLRSDVPSPGCEKLTYSSPTLRAAIGADVLAQLRSNGPYDAASITSITYSTVALVHGGEAALPSC
jgi:hypothetical protein